MVTIITGQNGLKSITSVATQKRDVGLKVALLDPAAAPLVLLTQMGTDPRRIADVAKAKLAKKETVDPKFEWIEDVLTPQEDAINCAAGYTAAETSIAVDNGEYFPTYCYVYVKRTGEIMYVSTGGSSPLTVTRGALSTTAAALQDNDELIMLPASLEEGSTPPTARTTLKSIAYNYAELIRTPVSMSKTMQNTAMLAEERDWDYQKSKAGIEHSKTIERKFLFSSRSVSDTGTLRKWTMNGLTSMITSNVVDAGGTMTSKEFDRLVCEPAFSNGRGSSYRILLASDRLNSVISDWGNQKLRTNIGDKSLGMVVNEYVSPHGVVYVIPHHLLGGSQGVCGILLDPEKAKYRYLQNMDTTWLEDVIKDGRSGKISEYECQVGLEYRNQETAVLLKNVVN